MFVRVSGWVLQWCSERLKGDAELVRLAVQKTPESVQYALGQIREELLSDENFMSRAIENTFLSGTILALAPRSMQEDKNKALLAAKGDLEYSNLPESMKSDEEVVLAALHRVNFDELCESLRTRDFIVKCMHKRPSLYEQLPEDMQCDHEIGMSVLYSDSHCSLEATYMVFEKIPALRDSRKALEALARKQSRCCPDQAPFYDIVKDTPMFADNEFLTVAVNNYPDILARVADDLRWDVDLVSAALDGYIDIYGQHFLSLGGCRARISSRQP